jgi:ketosteroid isomerase-like protein
MISQEIIRTTITSYFAANNALDVERFVNAFTADATLYYAGPISPITGTAAVRQVAVQSLTLFSKMQVTINRILFSEDGAAVSYTVHLTAKNGRTATTEGIDVMEINSGGKIQSIRFYMDQEPILALFQ